MRDLGAGGVRIDSAELDGSPLQQTGDIIVEDTRIVDYGHVFHQAVGIPLMRAFDCVIAHNEVAFGCYTGISCGWSWGHRYTVTHNIRIENNHVHHIGQGVLSDLGGIYLLGVQPRTVVRGNHVHHVESAAYGGWGIYPDEGSSHLVVERNWVHDTECAPFQIHYGREILVRDNLFQGGRKEALIRVGRFKGHIAAVVLHNVLLGPAPALFECGYEGDIRSAVVSDANLISFPPGRVPPIRNPDAQRGVATCLTLAQWRASGQDRRSIVASARLRVEGNRVVFSPRSPVWTLGVHAHDWSICGPRR